MLWYRTIRVDSRPGDALLVLAITIVAALTISTLR